MSMSIGRLAGTAALFSTGLLIVAGPALAQTPGTHTYMVPFVCGLNDGVDESAVMGEYATAITISNPHPSDTAMAAQAQLTLPPGDVSDPISRDVPAGMSGVMDCDTIASLFLLSVPLDSDAFYRGVLTVASSAVLGIVVEVSAVGLDAGISVHSRQVLPVLAPEPLVEVQPNEEPAPEAECSTDTRHRKKRHNDHGDHHRRHGRD